MKMITDNLLKRSSVTKHIHTHTQTEISGQFLQCAEK